MNGFEYKREIFPKLKKIFFYAKFLHMEEFFSDEAHERSMYSDVLIGLLTRIAPYRFRVGSPLKLVIMSATLRLDDFINKRHIVDSMHFYVHTSSFFSVLLRVLDALAYETIAFRLFSLSPPPVLRIDARQYPVSVHFEKRTPENYLIAAFHKICEIHEKKAPGTILVFLSGKLEVLFSILHEKSD